MVLNMFLLILFFLHLADCRLLFEATPPDIKDGLTDTLRVRCNVQDAAGRGITRVARLEIFRLNNGLDQILASINADMSPELKPGAGENATVCGSVTDSENFLEITWPNPTVDLTGWYICEGSGISMDDNSLQFFNEHINITLSEVTKEDLIKELEETRAELQEKTRLLKEAYQTIASLGTSNCSTPTSNSCENLNLSPGYHVVQVSPDDGQGAITVLCHIQANGEGWIVFQKRQNGAVDFFRNFTQYENGFGTVSEDGEFWLGLKNIRRLILQNGPSNQLLVEMTELERGQNWTRLYPTFNVGPADGYTLTVAGFQDNGFGMSANSGSNFSTYDRDNLFACASAEYRKSGWWFPGTSCGYVNLNGEWGKTGGQSSMFWYEFYGDTAHPMGTTEMKFRSSA